MAVQKDINFGKLNFALGFNRTSAFPLDANSYFEDYAEAVLKAQSAANVGSSDSAFYIGQLIIVNDATEGLGLYQITGTAGNGTLTKFGAASSAEDLGRRVSTLEEQVTTINGKLILATDSADGFMSKEDKAKIDKLTETKIDTVKVDGVALIPDASKAVNVDIAGTYATKATVETISSDVNTLKTTVKSGMRYVGESTTAPVGTSGATVEGYTSFNNGDICFFGNKEFIYNGKLKTWRELGDEGTHATHDYVDNAVKTAKDDLTTEIGKVNTAVGTEKDRAQQAEQDLQAAINNKADNSTVTTISGKVDTLEEKVGSAKDGSTAATGLYKAIEDEAKARADADTAINGTLGTVSETVESQGTLISGLREDVGLSTDGADGDSLFAKVEKLRNEVGTDDTKGNLFERVSSLETTVGGLPSAFITGLKTGESNLKVEDGKLSLDKVSTDLLYNGDLELVLDGGAATK